MDDKQKDMVKEKVSLVQDYLHLFDGDEGKRVLLDLMEKGFILKPTYSPDGDRQSSLNEGKRELILYIMDMVTYNVQDLLDLVGTNTTKNKNGGNKDETQELFDFFESD